MNTSCTVTACCPDIEMPLTVAANYACKRQGRAGQGRAGQGRAGQVLIEQGKAQQGSAGQGRAAQKSGPAK